MADDERFEHRLDDVEVRVESLEKHLPEVDAGLVKLIDLQQSACNEQHLFIRSHERRVEAAVMGPFEERFTEFKEEVRSRCDRLDGKLDTLIQLFKDSRRR